MPGEVLWWREFGGGGKKRHWLAVAVVAGLASAASIAVMIFFAQFLIPRLPAAGAKELWEPLATMAAVVAVNGLAVFKTRLMKRLPWPAPMFQVVPLLQHALGMVAALCFAAFCFLAVVEAFAGRAVLGPMPMIVPQEGFLRVIFGIVYLVEGLPLICRQDRTTYVHTSPPGYAFVRLSGPEDDGTLSRSADGFEQGEESATSAPQPAGPSAD